MAKAKAVVFKTPDGAFLIGSIQCSNREFFDAQGCFDYCNSYEAKAAKRVQASKLVHHATILAKEPKSKEEAWWENRDNFTDVEIDYEVNQNFFIEG